MHEDERRAAGGCRDAFGQTVEGGVLAPGVALEPDDRLNIRHRLDWHTSVDRLSLRHVAA
jgi:hypothetical protein